MNCGNSAAIQDLDTITVCAWAYRNNLSSQVPIIAKGDTAAEIYFWMNNSSEVNCEITRATINCAAYSNTNCAPTGSWLFFAASLNFNGANGDQHLYSGNLTTLAAEVGAYAAQQVGGGARTGSTHDLGIGNSPQGNQAWMTANHLVDVVGLFNTNLALSAIQDFQQHPRVLANCVGLWFPGRDGISTAFDRSSVGNNGTIYNATLDASVPLPIYKKTRHHQNLARAA